MGVKLRPVTNSPKPDALISELVRCDSTLARDLDPLLLVLVHLRRKGATSNQRTPVTYLPPGALGVYMFGSTNINHHTSLEVYLDPSPESVILITQCLAVYKPPRCTGSLHSFTQ